MSLNIKGEEAHRLARGLARKTGASMTAAVTIALREQLQRVKRSGTTSLARCLRAIGKKSAPRFKEPYRTTEHGDLLYDERGLPR